MSVLGPFQCCSLTVMCRYEIMAPETIGLSREATDVGVVLGKHSGRNALRTRLAAMGYTLEPDALNEVRTTCARQEREVV
jgi:isopropylmalate/homocitrate/citramalate synthase